MNKKSNYKRINITLPQETVRVIDRTVDKGDRSKLIDRAVRFYVEEKGKANLQQELKEGYQVRSQRDMKLAEEWFEIE